MAGKYTDPLRECLVCGDIWGGVHGHTGQSTDTDRHKAAVAAAERKAK
jgi:hypothetical protein